jgi:hypothetical protein
MVSQGQAALEYMAMIGIALLISAPLIFNVNTSAFELQRSFQTSMAQNALNNIEEAASLVHSQGEPAKVTFTIRLPEGIKHTNVTDQRLHIAKEVDGGTTDIYNFLDFNVSGSIPNASGTYQMQAEAWNGQVNVSEK